MQRAAASLHGGVAQQRLWQQLWLAACCDRARLRRRVSAAAGLARALCAAGGLCADGRRHLQAVPAYGTPAEEIPTVRQACEMGLDALILRTEAWLDVAMDYEIQSSDGNSGVIATQLCAERSFGMMACLERPSANNPLAELHNHACNLAEQIRKGVSLGSMLSASTTEAPPLAL